MQSGTNLIQAFAIGAGLTLILFILLAIYFRIGGQLRTWLANLRMKSLFWRDRRHRASTRKRQ